MISHIIKLLIITISVVMWGCTTPEGSIANKNSKFENQNKSSSLYVHVKNEDVSEAIDYGKNRRSIYKLNGDFSIPIFMGGKKYYIIVKTPYYNIAKYALQQELTFQPLNREKIDLLAQKKAVTLLLTNNLKSEINIASVYMNMSLIRDGLKVNQSSVREPIYSIEELTKPGVYEIILQEKGTGNYSRKTKLIPFSFSSFK